MDANMPDGTCVMHLLDAVILVDAVGDRRRDILVDCSSSIESCRIFNSEESLEVRVNVRFGALRRNTSTKQPSSGG